jgi:hypothetical protein
MWLYGSGFPKSLDVGKAMDKARDDNPDRLAVGVWLRRQREAKGLLQKQVAAHWPSVTGGLTGCVANWEGGFNCPTWDQWLALKRLIGFGDEMDAEVWRLNGRKGQPGEAWHEREVIGKGVSGKTAIWADGGMGDFDITNAATDLAKQWDGWGTALKPGWEPIILARKPLAGTVAQNVAAHGTGGLNVDGCRLETGEKLQGSTARDDMRGGRYGSGSRPNPGNIPDYQQNPGGRWPANVVLSHTPECREVGTRKVKASARASGPTLTGQSESVARGRFGGVEGTPNYADADGLEEIIAWDCSSDCPVRLLDEQSGERASKASNRGTRHGAIYGNGAGPSGPDSLRGHDDKGGASRFFYVAKASRAEREMGLDGMPRKVATVGNLEAAGRDPSNPQNYIGGEQRRVEAGLSPSEPRTNHHPTVKPLALMRWLCRLVTPPGGTILDPFAGSFTTLLAAEMEGFNSIGIEKELEYVEIGRRRLAEVQPGLGL